MFKRNKKTRSESRVFVFSSSAEESKMLRDFAARLSFKKIILASMEVLVMSDVAGIQEEMQIILKSSFPIIIYGGRREQFFDLLNKYGLYGNTNVAWVCLPIKKKDLMECVEIISLWEKYGDQ